MAKIIILFLLATSVSALYIGYAGPNQNPSLKYPCPEAYWDVNCYCCPWNMRQHIPLALPKQEPETKVVIAPQQYPIPSNIQEYLDLLQQKQLPLQYPLPTVKQIPATKTTPGSSSTITTQMSTKTTAGTTKSATTITTINPTTTVIPATTVDLSVPAA